MASVGGGELDGTPNSPPGFLNNFWRIKNRFCIVE